MIPIITSGDDIQIKAILTTFDGAVADVSAATITAALQDTNGNQLIASTAQSSGTAGADWANGVVIVVFADTLTGSLEAGPAYLQIQVTISGTRTTWPLALVQIQKAVS